MYIYTLYVYTYSAYKQTIIHIYIYIYTHNKLRPRGRRLGPLLRRRAVHRAGREGTTLYYTTLHYTIPY